MLAWVNAERTAALPVPLKNAWVPLRRSPSTHHSPNNLISHCWGLPFDSSP